MKFKIAMTFGWMVTTMVSLAVTQPFERYQTIVDRQMFGPLPPGFDPTKMPNEVQKSSVSEKQLTKEQEKLQSSIHFSVINVTSEGETVVGFSDNSNSKAPVHYYLKVGETRNGWTVKAADPVEATMTIAKEDIEVSLKLGGNSAKDGGTSAAKPMVANNNNNRVGLFGGGSLRDRRNRRRQEELQAAFEKTAAAKEAERAAQVEVENAKREAERAEQRQQLMAIQEELKRVREVKEEAERKRAEVTSEESSDAQD